MMPHWYWAACRFLLRPSGHFFGDKIEEVDVSHAVRASNRIADAVESIVSP
jgi:hypothetical protein